MSSQQNFRVNSFVSDKAIKAPCQAISVLNLVLYGEQTVNAVPVVAGDRVLVNAQTVASENGIYNVEQTGWTRAGDWDGDRDATNGTIVIVAGDPLISLYQLDVTGTFTIGTSDATFVLMSTLDLAGNLASTANGLGASLVGIEDAAGDFVATDVEAALAEIQVAVDANATAITDAVATSGSFTGTLTGVTGTPTATIQWARIAVDGGDDIVILSCSPGIIGTGNATTCGLDGLPAALQPTSVVSGLCFMRDNSAFCSAMFKIEGSASEIDFYYPASANSYSSLGWTASGSRALEEGWTITYRLN